MGKYLSNCNEVVGVRTRAKARAAATVLSSSSLSMAVKKMRKASNNVSDLRYHRKITVVSDDNFLQETIVNSSFDSSLTKVGVVVPVNCTGGDDVSAEFLASCCSSNDNASTSNKILVDPEVESAETTSSRHLNLDNNNNNDDDEERRESEVKTVESENPNTPVMRSLVRKSTVQIKMPIDSEIDAFFAAAEKNLQKRFTDRYNFDVVKDVPLEGRYEWVPIKP